jgi:hypothetical protein
MLRIIADRVAPEEGRSLKQQTLALHQASITGQDAMTGAAKAVKATADKLVEAFAGHNFGPEDVKGLFMSVLENGLAGEYVDYAAAEQATMAIGSLLTTWQRLGGLEEAQFKAVNEALDKAYDAVENDEAYKPTTFRTALQAVLDEAKKI